MCSDAESSGENRRLMPRGGASRKVVNFQFLKYIYIARETVFGPDDVYHPPLTLGGTDWEQAIMERPPYLWGRADV